MALHSFYIKGPSSIPDLKEHAKKAIMGKDPGVMCGSLQLFNEVIKVSSVKGRQQNKSEKFVSMFIQDSIMKS